MSTYADAARALRDFAETLPHTDGNALADGKVLTDVRDYILRALESVQIIHDDIRDTLLDRTQPGTGA